jgi:hypothetical protein
MCSKLAIKVTFSWIYPPDDGDHLHVEIPPIILREQPAVESGGHG